MTEQNTVVCDLQQKVQTLTHSFEIEDERRRTLNTAILRAFAVIELIGQEGLKKDIISAMKAIKQGGPECIIALGDYTIEAGDRVLVCSLPRSIKRIEGLFR